MRYFTPVALLCALLFFTFSSCQKNLTDDTPGVDSTTFSPKQMIISDANSPSLKQYYSLKYASDKSQIDVYFDDTTNSNPYDVLASSYIFNSSGHLIKSLSKIKANNNFYFDTVIINRGNDNKIISIRESYNKPGNYLTNDTCLFNYANITDGTVITVAKFSGFFQFSGSNSFSRDTNAYTYNAANKLQQVKKNNRGTYSCSYNSNGSLQSIRYADNNNGSVDASFSYNSGLPDDREDYLAKLLLGKDYYLQDITNFPKTGSNYDEPNCCVISITNPYHISKMHVVTNLPGVTSPRDYIFSYQQNKFHLPVFSLESGFNQLTEFRY